MYGALLVLFLMKAINSLLSFWTIFVKLFDCICYVKNLMLPITLSSFKTMLKDNLIGKLFLFKQTGVVNITNLTNILNN